MQKIARSTPSCCVHDKLDLIWGVGAIAEELNLTRRQAYHQLEAGRLPARKQSGKWCASRVGLRNFFADLLAGAVDKDHAPELETRGAKASGSAP